MLPTSTRENTVFIGHSRNITSMVRDTISLDNRSRIRKIFREDRPTHFYLHNYHPLDHYVASLSNRHNCRFIYHVHEPYVPDKKLHGGIQQYWLYGFEYLQGKLLTNTDIAVMSSKQASTLFEMNYKNFLGKKLSVPLMYEDLGDSSTDQLERKYITFVGPPVPAKNPEKFLEMVEYSNRNHLGLKFMLISRTRVDDNLYHERENLEIIDKRRISDQEFGAMVKRSVAVITPYKRETQSSVILVSYMYGTPVLSSNVGGLPEFVSHKKTGYLVDVEANADDWIEGVEYIRTHFLALSVNCRRYFEENFSGKNWKKYLQVLLSDGRSTWMRNAASRVLDSKREM
jgi:glycosyltransferase involved in cell wall biosynthesis